jgi:DNA polymerase
MFIGEGPGFHENQQGLPFVGAAGSFLDELLTEAGLKREDVFITNVVNCRPPGNRDPQPEELEACKPYLERQIAVINPDVIVTLGRFSMGHFINNGKISSIHGRSFWSGGRMIVPMYHPAAALHQPSLRSVVVEDFQKLPGMIKEAQEARRSNPDLASLSAVETLEDTQDDHGTEQLSLF